MPTLPQVNFIEFRSAPGHLLFVLYLPIIMPRNYVKKNSFHKYAEADLNKAVDAVESGRMSQNAASKEFGIPRGTLQNRIRGVHKKKHGTPFCRRKRKSALLPILL